MSPESEAVSTYQAARRGRHARGELDTGLVAQKVDEVAATAHDMAQKGRHTVTHKRGTEVIEAGAIRFGLEVRQVGQDDGMAIHVLSDVAGQEIELLASALREVEAKVPPMMAAARG